FSILADPTNANVLYVGGDRKPDAAAVGGALRAGWLLRGDASQPANSQWQPIVYAFAQQNTTPSAGDLPSAPHADSRGLLVQPQTGDLLEVDDGGVYRLRNPGGAANQRRWESLNGDLKITEVLSVAYDPLNAQAIAGTQDNGSLREDTHEWREIKAGDGGIQAAVVEGNQ